jgi:hypothetical protein
MRLERPSQTGQYRHVPEVRKAGGVSMNRNLSERIVAVLLPSVLLYMLAYAVWSLARLAIGL